MKKIPFDTGEGDVFVLDALQDWEKAPKNLKALVPDAMVSAWKDFPNSFNKLASDARGEWLRKWLAACAMATCHLKLYNTVDFPPTAFLEIRAGWSSLPMLLDFRSIHTATEAYPETESNNPEVIPKGLAELYDSVGGITFQYGCSGMIIPPDALRPLESWWDDQAESCLLDDEALIAMGLSPEQVASGLEEQKLRHWIADSPGAPSLEQLDTMYPFYEDSGDFLCFDPDGNTMWIGKETGGVMPFGTVSQAIDRFFECLLSGVWFTRCFEPI